MGMVRGGVSIYRWTATRGYKVQQLRDELTKRGLASDGVRQVLMQRLEAAISP